ncbi:MAG: glycine cleavage system protein GcvH [Alphaproteobacteria bacterium]|nr:MAG: glycine cleavage system protein GcvH [Alphaproteobacteria bacterium]
MSDLKYTEQHEWVRVKDGIAEIGISDYAAEQLGDVVYVELPETGFTVEQSGEIAVVESVKAASEIYAPVSGEVVEVNTVLDEDPATVNAEPTGKGWMVRLKLSNEEELATLMDADAYKTYLEGLE